MDFHRSCRYFVGGAFDHKLVLVKLIFSAEDDKKPKT
jgi:hypothetical protein